MNPLSLDSPVPSADLIDQVCDAFEQAWREGQRPGLENYLGRAEGPLRARLWAELLLSELECRRRRGEAPTVEEYLERFPDRHEDLARLFREAATPPQGAELRALLPPAAEPGRQVGGYELLREVGRGGMGVVYEARQVALNRTVALKMILAGAHAGAEERAPFRREAEAAARLR